MVYLRVMVTCSRCQKKVSKSEVREIKTEFNQSRFECYNCFTKNKKWKIMSENWGEKKELYCEKCRYKFQSRKGVCPYCNESEFISESDVSVHDLL